MNPWHDVDPGKRVPEIVECIIELPRGSRNKYELDKKSGLLRLDRVLYSAVFYPANYGFIPRTYWDDGDPLDILVLGQEPVVPMCIVTARPIGVMQMVDENEEDDKIIAIHENDPAVAHFRDISQLPEHSLNELQRFFEDYKILEHKKVRIERFMGRVDAHNVITRSFQLYQELFTPQGDMRPDTPVRMSELHAHMRESSGLTSRTPSRSARVEAARRAAVRLQADVAPAQSVHQSLETAPASAGVEAPQPEAPQLEAPQSEVSHDIDNGIGRSSHLPLDRVAEGQEGQDSAPAGPAEDLSADSAASPVYAEVGGQSADVRSGHE